MARAGRGRGVDAERSDDGRAIAESDDKYARTGAEAARNPEAQMKALRLIVIKLHLAIQMVGHGSSQTAFSN